MNRTAILTLLALTGGVTTAHATDISSLLNGYRASGAGDFSAQRGAEHWSRETPSDQGPRACTSCHGTDLDRPSEHVRTAKIIEPMDPRATPERYTDAAKVEKWFLRNCKWTWGRECTAQEKGDLLTYLNSSPPTN